MVSAQRMSPATVVVMFFYIFSISIVLSIKYRLILSIFSLLISYQWDVNIKHFNIRSSWFFASGVNVVFLCNDYVVYVDSYSYVLALEWNKPLCGCVIWFCFPFFPQQYKFLRFRRSLLLLVKHSCVESLFLIRNFCIVYYFLGKNFYFLIQGMC